MTWTPEFILQLIIACASGVGAYAAIRADLARLHERTNNTKESVDVAHQRIDRLQEKLH